LAEIMVDHDVECVRKEIVSGQIKRINN
jgi:hypothetical protein